MPTAPTVLIVANPYEAERMRRAVEESGFRAAVAEQGDDAPSVLAELRRSSAQVVVLASNLMAVGWSELLQAVRGTSRAPVLLIDDGGATAAARGVERILRRPIDP